MGWTRSGITQSCRWRWPRDCAGWGGGGGVPSLPLSPFRLPPQETLHRDQNVTCERLHQRSRLHVTLTRRLLWSSTDWMQPDVLCSHSRSRPILYIHSPQGKMTFRCPLKGWMPARLVEERKTLSKGKKMVGVKEEFLSKLFSYLGKVFSATVLFEPVRKWTWNIGNTEKERHKHWVSMRHI